MLNLEYQPVIGLEVHVELKTKSKMFCGCPADWFSKPPNSQTCPVCLGLPGALPVPNKKAVEWCVMLGLALNCEIPLLGRFDRKHYFYPDLPKGYQISQYDQPFCTNGSLTIKSQNLNVKSQNQISKLKTIRIRRVHMEEDTGKLLHAVINGKKCTLIDFNRSGVPLVEIVTEPDIKNSEEARIFLKKLHQVIKYLGISDADMEKGSMRLEPNISVRKYTSEESLRNTSEVAGKDSSEVVDLPSYKVEVKNINSFNFVKRAIDYEIERQIELLKKGEIPVQETRGWDEKKNVTYSQRSKEEAHDYRYFPDPDIPPVRWTKSQISNLKSQISEMPDEKKERFIKSYNLSENYADILTQLKELADFFEECARSRTSDRIYQQISPKDIANYIVNKKVDISQVSSDELLKMLNHAKQIPVFDETAIAELVNKILKSNPKAVADYKKGKENALMFLIGQVMREAKMKLPADNVRRIITKALK